jgi:hypothetical protein
MNDVEHQDLGPISLVSHDSIRVLLDEVITLQIKSNEYVITKGAKLLVDCDRYFHLQNGCYSKDKDDVLVENGCMEFYYQAFFVITEQIFTLFKAGCNSLIIERLSHAESRTFFGLFVLTF